MPSNAPTIVASGMTLSQFRSAGLPGLFEAIAAKNNLSPAATSALRNGGAGLERAYRSFHSAVDSYLTGDPVLLSDLQARISEFTALAHALAEAADEVGQLVTANPGTIVDVLDREPGDPLHRIKSVQKKRVVGG